MPEDRDPSEVEPELLPIWERQEPVWLRCGQCPQQRRLAQLWPMDRPSDGPIRTLHIEGVTYTNPSTGRRARVAPIRPGGTMVPRPSIRLERANAPQDDPNVVTRVKLTCHRKCGGSYTWRMDTLLDAYVITVRSGRSEIIAGVDV
jgi:hypothetical protein